MDFDLGNMAGLMGMFQQRMADFKRQAEAMRCEGQAGGGAVKVLVNGANEVLSVSIADSVMDDRELLEDLVRAATGEALRKAREQLQANLTTLTGGLPIPPGMLPF